VKNRFGVQSKQLVKQNMLEFRTFTTVIVYTKHELYYKLLVVHRYMFEVHGFQIKLEYEA